MPKKLSLLRAFLAALAVLLLLLLPTLRYRSSRGTQEVFARYRWIAFLVVSVASAVLVFQRLFGFLYLLESIKANEQHYANVVWLRQYCAAAAPLARPRERRQVTRHIVGGGGGVVEDMVVVSAVDRSGSSQKKIPCGGDVRVPPLPPSRRLDLRSSPTLRRPSLSQHAVQEEREKEVWQVWA